MNKIALERKQQSLSFSPSVQHARITDTMVQCDECSMWHLVFSKWKLSVAARRTLQEILEDVSYTCGASLHDLDLPDSLSSIVIRSHQCGDAIERLYYSAGYEDVYMYFLCYNIRFSSISICSSCQETNQPVQKRKKCLSLIFVLLFCVLFFMTFFHQKIFHKIIMNNDLPPASVSISMLARN